MTDLSISERLFNKALFHSEQDRQDFINQKAKQIEQHLYSVLLKDESEAEEIGGLVAVNLTDFEAGELVRYTMRKDAAGLLQFVALWIDEVVKNTAFDRAAKEVEAMTPEDFKN